MESLNGSDQLVQLLVDGSDLRDEVFGCRRRRCRICLCGRGGFRRRGRGRRCFRRRGRGRGDRSRRCGRGRLHFGGLAVAAL